MEAAIILGQYIINSFLNNFRKFYTKLQYLKILKL